MFIWISIINALWLNASLHLYVQRIILIWFFFFKLKEENILSFLSMKHRCHVSNDMTTCWVMSRSLNSSLSDIDRVVMVSIHSKCCRNKTNFFFIFQNHHIGMSKVMSTFTTKHQFVSNTKIHCPNPNWHIVRPNKWKNCIRKSVDGNIYKNCRTWAIAGTPTILHRHKSHRSPWIDTMILDRMHHRNHHYCQELSLGPCTISRVKLQGKSFWQFSITRREF